MEYKISFSVMGSVTQTIEPLINESIENIVKKLNSGEYLTTIMSEEAFIISNDPFEKIAKIIDTDNECEYNDFIEY